MKFSDYSPATSPSLDQQRDALQKGLGRAMQWAMTGQLDEAELLDACLHDLRYDHECEESRGTWLWQIVQARHAEDRFRSAILEAMHHLTDERTTQQLCELAFHYASGGDEAFRSRLYQIVEAPPFDDIPWLVEWPILHLDRERGFLFAARIRGQQLAKRDWEWHDQAFLSETLDLLGEGRVNELLETTTDGAIKRFRDGWLRQKTEEAKEKCLPQSEPMQKTPISEIISKAESGELSIRAARRWGMYATEQDLEIIRQRLIAASARRVIANYLKVFSNREFLPLVSDLLKFCRHDDDEGQRLAFVALAMNSDPTIRQFALAELQKRDHNGPAISLLVKNYQQGDEQHILEAFEPPVGKRELHRVLIDVFDVLEENPHADCFQLGIVAYALTPCPNCRVVPRNFCT